MPLMGGAQLSPDQAPPLAGYIAQRFWLSAFCEST
jgi:hypothetical protein